jgi:hypothetical protein
MSFRGLDSDVIVVLTLFGCDGPSRSEMTLDEDLDLADADQVRA